MTDDILARLRDPRWAGEGPAAADEISRLRTDLAAERTQREFGQELAKELQADLAATLERMSKLDFERTAAELERNAARAALAVEREDKQCAVDEAEARRDDLAAANAEKELAYKMNGALSEKLYQTTIERDAANERMSKLDFERTAAELRAEKAEADLAAARELLNDLRTFVIYKAKGDFHTINGMVDRIDAALKGNWDES